MTAVSWRMVVEEVNEAPRSSGVEAKSGPLAWMDRVWSHIDRGRALGLVAITLTLLVMPEPPAIGGPVIAAIALAGLVVIGLKAVVRGWSAQLLLERLMWPILIAEAGAACLLREPDHVLLIATALAVYAAVPLTALGTAGLLVWTALLPAILVKLGIAPPAPVNTGPELAVLGLGLVIGRTLGGDPLAAVVPRIEQSLADDSDFENRAPERVLQRLLELLSGDAVLLVSGTGEHTRVSRLVGGALVSADDELASALRDLGAERALDGGQARLIDFEQARILGRGRFGLDEGTLAAAGTGAGYLVAMPIGASMNAAFVARTRPNLAGLLLAEAAAKVLMTIGERMSAMRNWRARVLREARQQMGRDIHDSILQSLAGIRMQIAALRAAQRSGNGTQIDEIAADIDEILEGEQVALRAMISEARIVREDHDLFAFLRRRLDALGRQWRITITTELPGRALPVTEETALECEFLLREIFSNAVRHADATRIGVSFSTTEEMLIVTVKTNGRRVPIDIAAGREAGLPIQSASLGARLRRLGATAYSEPVASGTLLSIRLPMEKS
jgi:signal transduction histidine kinase